MEFNQENFDKLLEENGNYKTALQEERTKRKTAQTKLIDTQSELEETKAKLTEGPDKVKTEYEAKLQEKENEVKELKEKLPTFEQKATKYDELLNKSLTEKLAKIPEEKKEFVTKVLEGKDHDSQVELLDGFITDYTKPVYKAKAEGDGSDPANTSKLEEAKSKGDVFSAIKNARVIE